MSGEFGVWRLYVLEKPCDACLVSLFLLDNPRDACFVDSLTRCLRGMQGQLESLGLGAGPKGGVPRRSASPCPLSAIRRVYRASGVVHQHDARQGDMTRVQGCIGPWCIRAAHRVGRPGDSEGRAEIDSDLDSGADSEVGLRRREARQSSAADRHRLPGYRSADI